MSILRKSVWKTSSVICCTASVSGNFSVSPYNTSLISKICRDRSSLTCSRQQSFRRGLRKYECHVSGWSNLTISSLQSMLPGCKESRRTQKAWWHLHYVQSLLFSGGLRSAPHLTARIHTMCYQYRCAAVHFALHFASWFDLIVQRLFVEPFIHIMLLWPSLACSRMRWECCEGNGRMFAKPVQPVLAK